MNTHESRPVAASGFTADPMREPSAEAARRFDHGHAGGSGAAISVEVLDHPEMLYPDQYVWFVFVATLDITLTWIVLAFGGAEANPIANAVLNHFGLPGMVAFKYCLVVFVVVMCEWIGRRNPRAGFKMSEWSVAISSIPVTVSLFQLTVAAW